MRQTNKVLAFAATVIVVIGCAMFLLGRSGDSHTELDGCILVLGPSGLYCGNHLLASANDDQLSSAGLATFKRLVAERDSEASLVVRSEVPFVWFEQVVESLGYAGVKRFELFLEDSICRSSDVGADLKELVQWGAAIQARQFEAEIAPRSDVEREDGPDIVRIQPYGFLYEIGQLNLPSFAECDKEMFTFCDPDAEPNQFLKDFEALRRSAQRTDNDPLGLSELLANGRVEAARLARQQYPFETIRGQLGRYWSHLQLEVLDELPMAVVLETIDALFYQRTAGEPGGHTENIPNSRELRCQVPQAQNVDVLMLAFSDEQGIILTERKKAVPIGEQ